MALTGRVSRYVLPAALGFLTSGVALAQSPLLASAHSIAGGDATTRVDPVEQTLTISTAGIYHLNLTDLGQPAPFAEVTLAVTSGTTIVGSATVTAGGAASFAQVNAPAGTYVVHVVGALTAGQLFGTVGVDLRDASGQPVNGFSGPGGTSVSGFTAALSLPPSAVPQNARVIDSMIAIGAAGSYELDARDLLFPAALGSLQLSLADPAGHAVAGFPVSASGGAVSVTFTATPGNYHLVGGAQAASGAAGGLYNIHVFDTASHSDALNQSGSLGQVAPLGAAALSAATYQLAMTDFGFPKALAQGSAVAVQGGALLASTASGSPAAFSAASGNCELFALAVPDTVAASGSYGVTLAAQGGAVVLSSVQATSSGAGGAAAFAYPVTIASGGSYTLTLADFEFPLAFTTIALAAAQNGALLGTPLTAPGSIQISPSAGQAFILAAASPGTGGKGVFGIELAPSGGGASVLDRTQGVGGAFGTTTLTVPSAGNYNVTLSDLSFPGNFNELAAVVTQGPTRLGSIFGGGTFTLAATPGSYVINVLGTPQPIIASSSQTAGTYGVEVAQTPPAPTVMLTASAAEVISGGTVTLSWSSQNATDCTASGGWSGGLTTQGVQESPPITSATTFTVTCSGGGGSGSQSVRVSIKAPASQGGGGSIDAGLLLALVLGVSVRLPWRRGKSTAASRTARASVVIPGLLAALAARADGMNPGPVDASYLVQPGDVLQVMVWKEQELQSEVLVRPDGGLSFPLAGDIEAGGHTVIEIRDALHARLLRYIPDPVITVAVKAANGSRIFVVGKVTRPGDFPLIRPIDVMQALSLAGGTTAYADVNGIRVLRREGDHQIVFGFRYDDVRRGRELAQNILLRSGDTVVVP